MGGAPVPITTPDLGSAEAEAAARVIRSGWLTQGPEVALFEQEFAAAVGARHACAVSNCTTALHLALLAAGVSAGDEVITVSHSYIATANAVRYCGARPVFVDVQPGTGNIDPVLVDRAVTPHTRAILCVHQIGLPCDLRRVIAAGRRHALPVIEDAACAIGSEILWNGEWQRIGKPHGDIACFSFHPRKVITTGDGGMLTTSHAEFDGAFRRWRQHSMSVPDTVRHGSSAVVFESYPEVGFNYRMTDLQAAIGREQLKRLDAIVAARRAVAARYREWLADVPGLGLPDEPSWARTNWQSYCVRLPDGVPQKAVMQALLDEGIATRRGVMCAHREAAYEDIRRTALPVSERIMDRSILLPIFGGLDPDTQRHICDRLAAAVRPADELSA